MRQLIARIDERLHERLKRVAKREGRSVNSIVIDSLTRTVDELDRPETAQEWKARMIAEGRIVVPPEPDGPGLSRDEILEMTRGLGTAVSDQLVRDRRKDYW